MVQRRIQELANSEVVADTRLNAIPNDGYDNIAAMFVHTSWDPRADMMNGTEVETGRTMDTLGNIDKNMKGCRITLARVERLLDRMTDTEVETGTTQATGVNIG